MYDEQAIASMLGNEPASHRDRIGEPTPWAGKKKREVTTEWVLGPGRDGNDEGSIVLRLTTYHYGKAEYVGQRSNEYATTMRVVFVGDVFERTSMAFGTKGESIGVHRTQGVARFSAKAMREHHAEALRIVTEEAGQIAGHIVGGVEQYVPKAEAS